jgi:hypothetical protein
VSRHTEPLGGAASAIHVITHDDAMADVVPDEIERIEVISGPGATLWVANAVNGVINITTRSSRDTQGGFRLDWAPAIDIILSTNACAVGCCCQWTDVPTTA